MNFKKLLLLFVITLTAVSCKNDDDGGGSFLLNSDNLAGTYDVIFLEDVEEETFLVNEVPINSVITTVGDTFQIDFVITSNNTFTISGEYRTTETTVVGQADPIVDTEIVLLNTTGAYNLDANTETITLTEGGVSETYTITRFNENEVRLVYEESEVVDDLPYSFRSEIHLRRQ